jgi:hypothetical protein
MKTVTEVSTRPLMPVFDTTGCCGHILRTARGFRACDRNDRQIGVFETPPLAIAALLEAAIFDAV